MLHYDLLKRFLEQRENLHRRIQSFSLWLDEFERENPLQKSISLSREKFEEQNKEFRQINVEIRNKIRQFNSEIYSRRHHVQIFTDDDRQQIESIRSRFEQIEKQSQHFAEQVERIRTCLTSFHNEHLRLVDHYGKYLRFYSEHLKDDLHCSKLKYFLENSSIEPIEHSQFTEFTENLLQISDVEDFHEINQSIEQIDDYRRQYETFLDDLKSIVQCREEIFHRYQMTKSKIKQTLDQIDRSIRNSSITLVQCQQIVDEHQHIPIDQLETLSEQCVQFYSSSNLLELYRQLKLVESTDLSQASVYFRDETKNIVEFHRNVGQRLRQLLEYLTHRQQAHNSIETARKILKFDEQILLSNDLKRVDHLLDYYQVVSVFSSCEKTSNRFFLSFFFSTTRTSPIK